MTFNRSRAQARPGRPRFSGRKTHAQGQARPSSHEAPRAAASPSAITPQPAQPRALSPEIAASIPLSPFTALGLDASLVRAVLEEGYVTPSPVQKEVIPPALLGRDVLACAQTGTGKTAGFVLPMIQQLSRDSRTGAGIRGLILCPTRELAIQIAERITAYGQHLGLRHAVIYGGVNQKRQEVALAGRPDIVIATPGRLLDLLQQRLLTLDHVTHFVLDEADRMLDMGFVHDVRRVVAYLSSKPRQTLFFSATIAPPVEALARTMLKDPFRVSIAPKVTTSESVDQSVVFVQKNDKRGVLMELLADQTLTRVLVFTRTKHGANRLTEQLDRAGIRSLAIHGNKAQNARERALEGFRSGAIRVLVATDVAARGIDVEGITLVVNFELPNIAESYVHRIGRTGRAAATGRAISFCDPEERAYLRDIERFIRKSIPVLRMQAAASSPTPTLGTGNPNAPARAESTPLRSHGAQAHAKHTNPSRSRETSGAHGSSNPHDHQGRHGHTFRSAH
ncbi:MAG: DEAD/DEAH box helicase [Polyangiaceae bacterium]